MCEAHRALYVRYIRTHHYYYYTKYNLGLVKLYTVILKDSWPFSRRCIHVLINHPLLLPTGYCTEYLILHIAISVLTNTLSKLANRWRWANVILMLGQRRRSHVWSNYPSSNFCIESCSWTSFSPGVSCQKLFFSPHLVSASLNKLFADFTCEQYTSNKGLFKIYILLLCGMQYIEHLH